MEQITSLASLIGVHPAFIIILIIWTLVWKGWALWRAAELREKTWFVALLIVNTLGILEIIYIFMKRKYEVEVIEKP